MRECYETSMSFRQFVAAWKPVQSNSWSAKNDFNDCLTRQQFNFRPAKPP
jgi:hypothetical protein